MRDHREIVGRINTTLLGFRNKAENIFIGGFLYSLDVSPALLRGITDPCVAVQGNETVFMGKNLNDDVARRGEKCADGVELFHIYKEL